MISLRLPSQKQFLVGDVLQVTRSSRAHPVSKHGQCIVSAQMNFDSFDENEEVQRPLDSLSTRFFAVDGHPPALSQDWRLVRAQLVARELGSTGTATATPGSGPIGMLVKPAQHWAHQISHPEAGCLLVARSSNLGMFSHSVVLVTEHDDATGTSALMINMPTPICISNLGLEEDITSSFGHRPLFLGGPMTRHLLHVLHGRPDVDGSMRIVDGVYAGGVESASELIRQGRATPEEFCLLAGYSGWGPKQLAREVVDGSWWVVSASPALILDCITSTAWDPTQMGLPGNADTKMVCWRKVLAAANIRDHTM